MAPLRSLGNIRSAFDDFYARTGKDAVTPDPSNQPFSASGGTTTTFGNYKAHIFEYGTSDNFEVTSGTKNIDILVVGGGGGGATNNSGSNYGGNGGCGAYITGTYNVSATDTWTVTVGAGGAGGISENTGVTTTGAGAAGGGGSPGGGDAGQAYSSSDGAGDGGAARGVRPGQRASTFESSCRARGGAGAIGRRRPL